MIDESFTFSWDIQNFNMSPPTELKTDVFVVPILDHTSWTIELIIDGDIVCISLARKKDPFWRGPETVDVSVTFRLIGTDGTPGHEMTQTKSFGSFDKLYYDSYISVPEIETFYLLDGILRLECVLRKKGLDTLVVRNVLARTEVEVIRVNHRRNLLGFPKLRDGDSESSRLTIADFALFDVQHGIVGRIGQENLWIRFVRRSSPPWITISLIARVVVLDAIFMETEIWKKERFVFEKPGEDETWEFPIFISKASVMKGKYLREGTLTIKCDLTMSNGKLNNLILQNSVMVMPGPDKPSCGSKLTQDMKDLWISQRFADVRLRASDGDTVAAHRLILGSNSRRFAKMLEKRPEDDVVQDMRSKEYSDSHKSPDDWALDRLDNVLDSKYTIFDATYQGKPDDVLDSKYTIFDAPYQGKPDDVLDSKYTRFDAPYQGKPDNVLDSKYTRFDAPYQGKPDDVLDSKYTRFDAPHQGKPDDVLDSKYTRFDAPHQGKPDDVLDSKYTKFDAPHQGKPDDVLDSKYAKFDAPHQEKPNDVLDSRYTGFDIPYQGRQDDGVLDLRSNGSPGKFYFDKCPDKDGVLDLPDLDMSTLKHMLKFMYTKDTEDLEFEDATKLYIAAHDYQIVPLQCFCSFVLQSDLKIGNVCRVLVLADDSADIGLKKAAVDFIQRYWFQVILSEEWKKLNKERKTLAQETKETLNRTFGTKLSLNRM